jgi:uncharacterized paraquat-inducible protein A
MLEVGVVRRREKEREREREENSTEREKIKMDSFLRKLSILILLIFKICFWFLFFKIFGWRAECPVVNTMWLFGQHHVAIWATCI